MTLRKSILVLSLLLATPMLAQENDEVGIWSEIGLEKAITKSWDVGLDLEYRAQNKARFSTGLSTSYKLNKYLKLGLSYNFLYSEKLDKYKVKDKGEVGDDEWAKGYNFTPGYWYPRHRFSLEATGSIKLWKWLKISLRERYQLTHSKARTVEKYKFREKHTTEYYFGEMLVDEDGFPVFDEDWNLIFVDADGNPVPEEGIKTERVDTESRWESTPSTAQNDQVLRSRLKFELDKKRCPFSPFVSVEFHNTISDQRSTLPLQKIRTAAGTTYKFRKHNEVSLSYLITFDKEEASKSNDTHNFGRLHTICLGYKYSF